MLMRAYRDQGPGCIVWAHTGALAHIAKANSFPPFTTSFSVAIRSLRENRPAYVPVCREWTARGNQERK